LEGEGMRMRKRQKRRTGRKEKKHHASKSSFLIDSKTRPETIPSLDQVPLTSLQAKEEMKKRMEKKKRRN